MVSWPQAGDESAALAIPRQPKEKCHEMLLKLEIRGLMGFVPFTPPQLARAVTREDKAAPGIMKSAPKAGFHRRGKCCADVKHLTARLELQDLQTSQS